MRADTPIRPYVGQTTLIIILNSNTLRTSNSSRKAHKRIRQNKERGGLFGSTSHFYLADMIIRQVQTCPIHSRGYQQKRNTAGGRNMSCLRTFRYLLTSYHHSAMLLRRER